MRLLATSILIALIHLAGYGQKDYIEWNKDVKIGWSDFQGKVDESSPFAAMSAVGIHFKYNSWSNGVENKIIFEINSRFDRTKSWSRETFQSPYIIRHEQLHFDLAELVSRQFKKEAESTTFSNDYKNEVIRMYDKYMQYLQKLQQKYDDQTAHSRNKVKQKEWEDLVRQELSK